MFVQRSHGEFNVRSLLIARGVRRYLVMSIGSINEDDGFDLTVQIWSKAFLDRVSREIRVSIRQFVEVAPDCNECDHKISYLSRQNAYSRFSVK